MYKVLYLILIVSIYLHLFIPFALHASQKNTKKKKRFIMNKVQLLEKSSYLLVYVVIIHYVLYMLQPMEYKH